METRVVNFNNEDEIFIYEPLEQKKKKKSKCKIFWRDNYPSICSAFILVSYLTFLIYSLKKKFN